LRRAARLPIGMVLFAQTRTGNTPDSWRVNKKNRQRDASLPKSDKFKDYTRYAEHCLNLTAATTDQEPRCLCRDMAGEWLTLAMALRPSRKSWQVVVTVD
jgi:hypothetical protein